MSGGFGADPPAAFPTARRSPTLRLVKTLFTALALVLAAPLDASACLWLCASTSPHGVEAESTPGHCSERAGEPGEHRSTRSAPVERSPAAHDCEACELAADRAIPSSLAGIVGLGGSMACTVPPSPGQAIRVALPTTRSRAPPEPDDARIPYRSARAPLQI